MNLAPAAPGSATPAPQPPGNLVYTPRSIVPRLDYALLFPRSQPVEVELGCGDGTFLLTLAAARPERNFIGVERLLGRIQKLDRKGRRLGLANLRGVRLEAGYFLEFLLPPGSVEALHVYFPDPWPKLRHQRHRLVNERFPRLAAQALVPGGCVHLRTDDAPYFGQMEAVFGAWPLFRRVEPPSDLARIHTDFEREFAAQGKPTWSASYRRGEGLSGGNPSLEAERPDE
jgi:tRNA (guanine-N7-)-methyltransferase